MGNLYYNVLGNIANSVNNLGPFSNVKEYYWSATEEANNTSEAWYFRMFKGTQFVHAKTNKNAARAVHDGDVSTVSIPSAVRLFISVLIDLLGLNRCKT